MKKHCCNARCTLSTIGIILIAFGASFAIFWPQTFQYLMHKVSNILNFMLKSNLILLL